MAYYNYKSQLINQNDGNTLLTNGIYYYENKL